MFPLERCLLKEKVEKDVLCCLAFFFQAEDGIRDGHVTGVQTCALPICARRRRAVPTVALVGYTNAGKSTLFNRLAEAEVYVRDQLFATLDPTLRRLMVPQLGPVALADTVGFIRHLPHTLVEAFRATLEEVAEADLLLDVADASDPGRELHGEQVIEVLEEIGAGDLPRLEVYNKIDLLGMAPRIDRDESGRPRRVWLSAATGRGTDLLLTAIAECMGDTMVSGRLRLDPDLGRLRARLFEAGAVLEEQVSEDGSSELSIRMPGDEYRRLVSAEHIDPDSLWQPPQ